MPAFDALRRMLGRWRFVMWISNAAESANRFIMASRYPDLPALSLTIGPVFTFAKWAVPFAAPALALAGFGVGLTKRSHRISGAFQ